MFHFRRGTVQTMAATLVVAALVFTTLLAFSKRHLFFLKNQSSEESPEPLNYDAVGNFPPLETLASQPSLETEYTLELGTCDDTICIQKTLTSLRKKGVEAFYTPFRVDERVVFRIRRGIFSSRLSAERAKLALSSDKNIPCKVAEL